MWISMELDELGVDGLGTGGPSSSSLFWSVQAISSSSLTRTGRLGSATSRCEHVSRGRNNVLRQITSASCFRHAVTSDLISLKELSCSIAWAVLRVKRLIAASPDATLSRELPGCAWAWAASAARTITGVRTVARRFTVTFPPLWDGALV